MDILYLLAVLAFFASCWGMVTLFERLQPGKVTVQTKVNGRSTTTPNPQARS